MSAPTGQLRFWNGTEWIGVGSGTVNPEDLAYRHYQSVASQTWTVEHNLGFRPNVIAVDSAGEWIIPGRTSYLNDSTVELEFSAAVGGEAYCS